MDKANQESSAQASHSAIAPLQGLSMKTSFINEHIQEVTLSAQAPNPGYGIRVSNIEFSGEHAYITIAVVKPSPGKIYPQVISQVSVITYLDAAYVPELTQTEDDPSK